MSAEESGYLADPTHSTHCEPKEFDKITSADGDTTPVIDPNYDNISHTREHWTVRCFQNVRNLCFARFPMVKAETACIGKPLLEREIEKKESEGSVISVAESVSKKTRRNSIWSHSLQTHREFFSDERDLREDLERRAQQAVLE